MTDTITTTVTETGLGTLNTGWTADKLYSITFSTVNRMIGGLAGAIAPFDDVIHSDTNTESHYLGQITQDMYNAIAESITNPHQLAFWNTDNTLKIRKILVNFGTNTFLDNSRNSIVGIGNTITLIPEVVDENGTVWSDITQLQIKNMSKLDFPVSINGQDPSLYKSTSTNGSPITFQLPERGRVTIRIKAIIPELSSIWLSVYPELYGYDAAGLANLAAWAANPN